MPSDTDDGADPGDLFARLGHEYRVGVLRALAESWNEAGFDLDYAASFSDLRKEVGVDDSAQFNYHLQQLTDHFVRQTEDGYEFRYLGWKVARLLLSEGLHEHPAPDPVDLPTTCHACGHDRLVGRYVNEWLWLRCPSCDTPITDVGLRPEVVAERDSGELVATCDRRGRRRIDLLTDRVCADCQGDTGQDVREHAWGPDTVTRIDYHCPTCDTHMLPGLGWYALDHPDVVAFYDRRGVDVGAVPYWEIGPTVSDDYAAVLDEDPWRFAVTYPCDSDRIVATLDGEGHVLGVERP